jgi:DNA (cytosine-5)-methyltransferase 1
VIGATVCSGIGAPEAAMPWIDWRFAAEIDSAARAVYSCRHPGVELFGDFTEMKDDPRMVDVELLVGGTPCQPFSVAGLRRSLTDDRGNLSLEFIRLADAIDDLRRAAGRDDAIILWENVPGVLSTKDNAFGAFLGGLVGSDAALVPRGRWANAGVVAGPRRIAAWRVLDAQFFGVPQRRRRVFVLAHGHSRDWACADALLSVGDSLSRHPAPRREKGERVAALTSTGVGTCGADDNQGQAGHLIPTTGNVAHCLNAGGMGRQDYAKETLIAHTLRGEGFDASEDGTGRGTPLIAIQERAVSENPDAGPDDAGFRTDGMGSRRHNGVIAGSAVRRLTPLECERLQGFPDDFTLVPYRKGMMADGPRYKMLGNSMAVPVIAWIGQRIQAVEAIAAR